jgi:hypothetical protein
MKIRLRVIKPENRRNWEEPYIYVTGPGLPFHMAVLEMDREEQREPRWEQIEVTHDD